MSYVNLRSRPDPDSNIIATFLVGAPHLREAAESIAAESSIGTWTDIATMKPRVKRKLGAVVFDIRKNGIMRIAYPIDLFEPGNIPQLLSDIAGNIFGMKGVNTLKLLDFSAPPEYINTFDGPAFGMENIRKYMGTNKTRRPHVGTIVKPKVGLNPRETAEVAYDAWAGGIDFVKDDENLCDQHFCPFEKRVLTVLDAADRAEEETGEKKLYAANITGPADKMLDRAEFVLEHGGKCIMIDVITAGFSALQFIRSQNLKLMIHAHRAMYAAFSRNKRHGIAFLPMARLCRMGGADQLHIGTVVGKMVGEEKEVKEAHAAINGKMGNLLPAFSVCSGGLSPDKVPALMRILGNDIVIQAGGGIHGHPKGTRAGAAAIRQAVEASMLRINLNEYAKDHRELREALLKWPLKKL